MNQKRESGDFGVPESFTSIPLVNPDKLIKSSDNVFTLVGNAVRQTSDLFRAEIKLAKTEIFSEIRKGLTGSAFFIIALTILLFSLFFFFLFIAAVLAIWLPMWASFLIVFVVMLVFSITFVLLGVLKVIKIRAPKDTIHSVRQTASIRHNIRSKK